MDVREEIAEATGEPTVRIPAWKWQQHFGRHHRLEFSTEMGHIARDDECQHDFVNETHSLVEQPRFGHGVQCECFRRVQNPLHRIHSNVEIDHLQEERQLGQRHVHRLCDLIQLGEYKQFDHHCGGQQKREYRQQHHSVRSVNDAATFGWPQTHRTENENDWTEDAIQFGWYHFQTYPNSG